MKICPHCKLEQQKSRFSKDKYTKDGLHYECKDCTNKRVKQYRLNHLEEAAKYLEQYRLDHSEEMAEYHKQYQKNRRNTDPIFKLLCNFRTRIRQAIKTNSKSIKTKELIGCTIEELKNYLEFLFIEGMTWNNQGKWHVDHIKPCSSFDLSKPEEQRRCFHYSNLQPLWSKDNLKKSNKIKGS